MNLKETALQLIVERPRSAVEIAETINRYERYVELREKHGVGTAGSREVNADQVYAAMSGLRSKKPGKSLIEPVGGQVGKREKYRCVKLGALAREAGARPRDTAHFPPLAAVAPDGWPHDADRALGSLAQKKGRSAWRGRIVGWYRTELTALGYAIESSFEKGSVQIYPATALEDWDGKVEVA